MKLIDLLRMSSSSLWKRKMRTVLTIMGVVIGIASIIVMVSLGLGLNQQTLKNIDQYGGLTRIDVSEGGGQSYQSSEAVSTEKTETKHLDDKLVEEIRALPHVELVSPVLATNILAKSGIYQADLRVEGYSLEALQDFKLDFASGELPKEGDALGFIYGNQVLQDFYNAKTHQYFWDSETKPDIDLEQDAIFMIFDADTYYQLQNPEQNNPAGSTDTSSEKTVVTPPKKYILDTYGVLAGDSEEWNQYSYSVLCDIDALKAQLKHVFKKKPIPGQPLTSGGKPYKELFYSQLYVKVDSMDSVTEVQKIINEMGYQADSNAEWVEQMQSQYRSTQAMLGGIGAVSLLVAAIGIANTMMMSIYERTKEIGVMKVLGCDLRNIRDMFLVEAAYIGLIGGVIGIILSYGISAIINHLSIIGINGYDTASSYIPAWLSGLSLVFAVLVGMLAGFFPARRAMKLSPLAAIRNE